MSRQVPSVWRALGLRRERAPFFGRKAIAPRWLWPAVAAVGILTANADGAAQPRPAATVAVLVDADSVTPGGFVRVALRVSLPDGIHVQSNEPRDPLLIPTTIAPTLPVGLTLVDTAFPPAVDFRQAGSAQPLAVFQQSFAVGLKLAVASTATPGEVKVPIRFRYQACDDRTCFAPVREDLQASFHIVTVGATRHSQFEDVFAALHFVR